MRDLKAGDWVMVTIHGQRLPHHSWMIVRYGFGLCDGYLENLKTENEIELYLPGMKQSEGWYAREHEIEEICRMVNA